MNYTNGKELVRIPRVLGEHYNSKLLESLYNAGGSIMVDLIIYLSSYHIKDLFGESWFSVEDFCNKMGYNRTNLQRRLNKEQLEAIFGKERPEYVFTDDEGRIIAHPIETVFEAALYKLGRENLFYPVRGDDGRTSYNFVQILTKFDIKTNFKTNKSTKRLYTATLSTKIKDFMFSLYNLIELQDYRNLPSKYRYFYLELSKMLYIIRYKIEKNEAPFYALTVDQLAEKLDVKIQTPKFRKQKIADLLNKMNKYIQCTNFDFSFVKGKNEKWAYTVLFSFPKPTIEYFDEGQQAVFIKRFYEELLYVYASIICPDMSIGRERGNKVNEILKDPHQYDNFLMWANSSQNFSEKKKAYLSASMNVFGKLPEGYNDEKNNQPSLCISQETKIGENQFPLDKGNVTDATVVK